MGICLQIVHDSCGGWNVSGLPGKPIAHLASLADSIEYARRECAAAPATIELMVDGFYAVIHQAPGWPRRVVTHEHDFGAATIVDGTAHEIGDYPV
jgi:hypothetical protein